MGSSEFSSDLLEVVPRVMLFGRQEAAPLLEAQAPVLALAPRQCREQTIQLGQVGTAPRRGWTEWEAI